MSEETAQIKEKENVIYDADAIQHLPVGDGIVAVIEPYTDKRFDKYREDLVASVNELMKRGEESQIEEAEIKQAIEKDCELCDDLLTRLDGYSEELPDNWKESISAEDKIEFVRKAHSFVIEESGKKFSFGPAITISTACYFNGVPARQKSILRRKTIDDSSRYALLKSKEYKATPGKKLGEERKFEWLPQDEAKAALYDEMCERVEGFKNDKVPKRVKIMIIDDIFAPSVPEKK